MNPFDNVVQSIDNTVKLQSHTGDPLHDIFHDYITHPLQRAAVCNDITNALVNSNLIDAKTGKALLPLLEIVYDKIDPC